jgi:Tfp pilus assembly protein PilN
MIRINLIQERGRRRLIPESGVVLTAVLIIAALAASYSWGAWRNRQIKAQTETITKQIEVVRPQVVEVRALEAKLIDLKAREDLLRSLEAREVPWASMLLDLASRTPSDAWLASASIEGSSGQLLHLQGSAMSYTSIARFMTTLSGSNFYNNVDLQAAQQGEVGATQVVQFGLSLNLRPQAPPPPPKPAAEPAQ